MAEVNRSTEWAITALNKAETVAEVRRVLKGSARAAAQAQGATVVEREGDQCYYADEDAMSPLWKGQRFPVSFCISGWAMTHGQTVAVSDVFADGRVPHDAYRPTFVRSLVMVPITAAHPVGAVGVYWSDRHHASEGEVAALERLAEAAGRALARIAPGRVVATRGASTGHQGAAAAVAPSASGPRAAAVPASRPATA